MTGEIGKEVAQNFNAADWSGMSQALVDKMGVAWLAYATGANRASVYRWIGGSVRPAPVFRRRILELYEHLKLSNPEKLETKTTTK